MEYDVNKNEIENEKEETFKKEISNIKSFTQKLSDMYDKEFNEAFKQILILSKEGFMDFITNGINYLLNELYGENIFENQKVKEIQKKNISIIDKNYENHFQKINKTWLNFSKIKNNNNENTKNYYLTNFRKHCCDTDDIAFHNCQIEPNSKFISVEENKNIKYVICTICKMVYFSNFILCYCSHCHCDYYSSILSKNENPNLLIATWKNYHCHKLINEKMKCIKCKSDFYINLQTRMLNCLNKKCNFIIKPSRVLWTCTICKEDFKSEAIIYNPLQYEYLKQIIKETLMTKQKAHPIRMPCCKLNTYFTEYYHKKECNGILYSGELDHKLIIVCSKCKAINFYDRFIWTCPKCGMRFRDKNVMKKKTFVHMYQNKNYHSMSLNIQSERPYFFSSSRKGSQNDSEKTKEGSENKNNEKRKRAKTNLFDILERRRKNSENNRNVSNNNEYHFLKSERKITDDNKLISNYQFDERNSSPIKNNDIRRKLINMKQDNLFDVWKKRNEKKENIKPVKIGRNERRNIEKRGRFKTDGFINENNNNNNININNNIDNNNYDRNRKFNRIIKSNEENEKKNNDLKEIKGPSRREERLRILREEREKKEKEEKEEKERIEKEERDKNEKEDKKIFNNDRYDQIIARRQKENEEKARKKKEEKEQKEKEDIEKKEKLKRELKLKEEEERLKKEKEEEKLKKEEEKRLKEEEEERIKKEKEEEERIKKEKEEEERIKKEKEEEEERIRKEKEEEEERLKKEKEEEK